MTQAITTPTAPPVKMTFEEFLEWAEGAHAEWVNGEVQFMSPVSNQHSDIGRFLLTLLSFVVDALGAGAIRYEPFVMKTGPDLPGRSPDILFLAHEHRDRLRKNHLAGPADVVVEIVSPDDPRRDWVDKLAEYEQGGVREYWIIDPERQQAEFYLLGDDRRYHPAPQDEQGIFRSAVLQGVWLKPTWLWQSPLPSVVTVLKEWKLI